MKEKEWNVQEILDEDNKPLMGLKPKTSFQNNFSSCRQELVSE